MEVTSNEDAEAVRGSKDRMERFNRQMRFITAGLRASEGMVMPNFDVATYVKQHLVQSEAERQEKLGGGQAATGGAGGKGDRELQIAGANGSGIKEEGISIVMSGGIDEERARAERDKAAEAKKVQNALPAWHLQSTITGDLTSLGVAEQARAAAAAAQSAALAASSSGDDALRGLGTVNGRIGDTKMESMISMSEDVKVGTDSTPDCGFLHYSRKACAERTHRLR
jgi:transcription initiation factor TFIIE subunit alpha